MFLLGSLSVTQSQALSDLFISSKTSICYAEGFFWLGNLIMLLSQFPLTLFPRTSTQSGKGMPLSIPQLLNFLVLIWRVFMIIWDIPRGDISDRLEITAEVFLNLPNLLRLIKPESIPSQKFGNSVLNKATSTIPPLSNDLEVLPYAFDKAKLFAEIFSKNSNLDHSGISLSAFPSRTNLKLHNVHATHNLVHKVIINFDSSKVSCPYCIPMVVLK